MSITMNNEKFTMFLRSLSNLTNDYTDIDIRDGMIRSRNISRNMITEVDFKPILGEIHLPMLLLKQKLDLLKCFKNSDEINLDFTDDYFSFSDNLTTLKFRYFDDPEYVDNKHMDEQELQSVTGVNNDDIILSTKIDQTTSNRIKNIASIFNVEKIQFDFHNNLADILCEGTEQSATFIKDIPVEKEINATANVVVSPFNIDHDDQILIDLHELQNQKSNLVLAKVRTSIGDINMTIYVAKSILNPKE